MLNLQARCHMLAKAGDGQNLQLSKVHLVCAYQQHKCLVCAKGPSPVKVQLLHNSKFVGCRRLSLKVCQITSTIVYPQLADFPAQNPSANLLYAAKAARNAALPRSACTVPSALHASRRSAGTCAVPFRTSPICS